MTLRDIKEKLKSLFSVEKVEKNPQDMKDNYCLVCRHKLVKINQKRAE